MIHFEAERANPSGGIYHQRDKNLCFSQHLHNSFELIYLYSGTFKVSVDDRQFTVCGGEAILIFPNQIHDIKSEGESKSYLCVFENGLVGEFYRAIKQNDSENHVFKVSDESLIESLEGAEGNRYKLKSILYELIGQFVENCGEIYPKKHKSNEVIGKILGFIELHYTENITLQQVAREIGYDHHYLSNLLQKGLNTTFREMLNEYRISYAQYLLLSKENKISSVASECGYDSLCSFNRNFKGITGTTPIEFRRKKHICDNKTEE